MRKFLLKILIFCIPLILIIGPFVWATFAAGEIRDYDMMIEKQRNSDSGLFGMAYNAQKEYYKCSNVMYYKPEVLALGTSRVMQIRDIYFSSSFYNAGGVVSRNYDEYLDFLLYLSEQGYTPEVIILGLDSWVFNDSWYGNLEEYRAISFVVKDNTANTVKLAAKDFGLGKWTFGEVLKDKSDNIGFSAIINREGFRKDGSYVYQTENLDGDTFPNTIKRIEEGNNRFEWGTDVSRSTLEKLDMLLEYCHGQDIYVVGFIPPFAPYVFDKMEENGQYSYIKKIGEAVSPLFARYGYEVYDFQDSSVLSNEDGNYVDGFHGNELEYALIIEHMIEQDSKMKEYINEAKLESFIEATK